MYVDLLNEFPYWHGYDWLKDELNKRSELEKFQLDNPDAHIPDGDNEDEQRDQSETMYDNPLEVQFYNHYANDLLTRLKSKYPDLGFLMSLSKMNLDKIDLTNYDALDNHLWFQFKADVSETRQMPKLGGLDHKDTYRRLMAWWENDKAQWIKWMQGRIAKAARVAEENNIVCGNTEGWGSVLWYDHPELSWDFIKEAADICVDECLKYDNYKFICTSNFTHPQFKGIWDDIAWHKKITNKIKRGL